MRWLRMPSRQAIHIVIAVRPARRHQPRAMLLLAVSLMVLALARWVLVPRRVEAAVLDRLDPPLNLQGRPARSVRATIGMLRRQRLTTALLRSRRICLTRRPPPGVWSRRQASQLLIGNGNGGRAARRTVRPARVASRS